MDNLAHRLRSLYFLRQRYIFALDNKLICSSEAEDLKKRLDGVNEEIEDLKLIAIKGWGK
jgi:hypothetical protein